MTLPPNEHLDHLNLETLPAEIKQAITRIVMPQDRVLMVRPEWKIPDSLAYRYSDMRPQEIPFGCRVERVPPDRPYTPYRYNLTIHRRYLHNESDRLFAITHQLARDTAGHVMLDEYHPLAGMTRVTRSLSRAARVVASMDPIPIYLAYPGEFDAERIRRLASDLNVTIGSIVCQAITWETARLEQSVSLLNDLPSLRTWVFSHVTVTIRSFEQFPVDHHAIWAGMVLGRPEALRALQSIMSQPWVLPPPVQSITNHAAVWTRQVFICIALDDELWPETSIDGLLLELVVARPVHQNDPSLPPVDIVLCQTVDFDQLTAQVRTPQEIQALVDEYYRRQHQDQLSSQQAVQLTEPQGRATQPPLDQQTYQQDWDDYCDDLRNLFGLRASQPLPDAWWNQDYARVTLRLEYHCQSPYPKDSLVL